MVICLKEIVFYHGSFGMCGSRWVMGVCWYLYLSWKSLSAKIKASAQVIFFKLLMYGSICVGVYDLSGQTHLKTATRYLRIRYHNRKTQTSIIAQKKIYLSLLCMSVFLKPFQEQIWITHFIYGIVIKVKIMEMYVTNMYRSTSVKG